MHTRRVSNLATILLVVVFSFSISVFANGELAKPRYRIECRRTGSMLGTIDIELFPLVAPKAVHYFDSLVSIHFYDSTAFHRVVPGFVIQGGDPNSRSGDRSTWGQGDPSQVNVVAEFSPIAYVRGILGAARDPDTNSANSQFFICVANALTLNGKYTVYGQVVQGMNVADSIVHLPSDMENHPLDKVEMFVTKIGENDSIPDAPSCIAPVDEFDMPASASFQWTRSSGAVLYDVEVSSDSAFTDIVSRGTCGIYTASSSGPELYSLSGFVIPFHRYYWHVRANNGGHYSAYSAPASFVTRVASPVLISPDSASTLVDTSVTLHWHPALGATGYNLKVGTSPLFLSSSLIVSTTLGTDTQFTLSSLPPAKTVYWKVTALHDSVESPPRSIWLFHSLGSNVSSDLPDSHSLCYPQPASDVLYIHEGIDAQSFRLYDLAAQLVYARVQSTSVGADEDARIDVRDVPNGLYFAEFRGQHGLRQVLVHIRH